MDLIFKEGEKTVKMTADHSRLTGSSHTIAENHVKPGARVLTTLMLTERAEHTPGRFLTGEDTPHCRRFSVDLTWNHPYPPTCEPPVICIRAAQNPCYAEYKEFLVYVCYI